MEQNKLKAGGIFTVDHIRDGRIIDTWQSDNIVVDEGLNYLLDAALSAATPSTTFYLLLFSNNYTPIAATVITSLTEVNAKIDETTRPVWVEAGVSSKTITNTASPAAFTFNASETVYGAALCRGSAVKGETSVTKLIAASKFTSARNLEATDILNVKYTLTASSS